VFLGKSQYKNGLGISIGRKQKVSFLGSISAVAVQKLTGAKKEAIALVVPDALKGWNGNLGLIFGIEPLLIAASHYSELAQNARLGVSDTIPTNYEIKYYTPKQPTQKLDSKLLGLISQEEKQTKTQTMAQYQLYLLQALDSVFGQFPIKIRIEDNDLIQTGNQDLEIKLPNLAETLAEMVGQNLSQQAFTKALLEIGLRNLAETGQTKQQAIQNYYAALANQEYLGYKVKQKAKDVDFLFDPSVVEEDEEDQSLSRALQNKTLKVPIDEFDDEQTLEGQVKILIEAARIIKAKYWRGIDLKGDSAAAIANLIKSAVKIGEQSEQEGEQDLEEFFESVEKGFADKSALLDPTKPYYKDYDRRPKIRKLDGDQQLNATKQVLAGQLGETLGNAFGFLACGVLPAGAIAVFNEPLGAYLLREVGEEALDEFAANFAQLIRLSFRSTAQYLFISAFKNVRFAIKRYVSNANLQTKNLIDKIFGGNMTEAIKNWGEPNSKPWSFRLAVEEAIDNIDNPVLQEFVEEFYDEALDACVEAGYVIAGGLDTWYLEQALAKKQQE
jgi:hypothetical protein